MAFQDHLKNIIINADDFGLRSSVNMAIIELFNKDLINSTTIMANMPFFEEAIELAIKNNLINRIGIHLNLDEGHHLTNDLDSTDLFDSKNNYRLRKGRFNLLSLSNDEKKLIYKEFSAQIEKVRKTGIHITHIDTHHHLHEFWPLTQIILALLKDYGIQSMRILNNLNHLTASYKLVYRKMVNIFIKARNKNLSDYFGNQLEVMYLLEKYPSINKYKRIEIMVHPDFDTNGIAIDILKGKNYDFEYSKLLLKQI